MAPPPRPDRPRLLARARAPSCLLLLLLAGARPAGALSNLPGPAGPHVVARERHEVPNNGTASWVLAPAGPAPPGGFPGVVFAHGLCSEPLVYRDLLENLASHGVVVIANDEQTHCGGFDPEDPIGSALGGMLGFVEARNATLMAEHVASNVDTLLEHPDVDPERVALVGHSMGGGVAINVAAASPPGLIKAVVAIAPWNGFARAAEAPSARAADVEAPVLLICSQTDIFTPCRGPAFTRGVPAAVSERMALWMPVLYGPGATLRQNGGSDAIFAGAGGETVLLEAWNLTHFAIAHLGEEGASSGLEGYLGRLGDMLGGVDLLYRERAYEVVPTLEYAWEFLGEAFARANATTAAAEGRAVESYDGSGSLVERARADARFKRVKRWTPGGMFDGWSTGGL